MERRNHLFILVAAVTIISLSDFVECTTDPADVQALQILYTSLNSPSQLTNWNATGGDPCGDSWKGLTCQGPAVVSLQIPGLGLDGTLGYMLSGLTSLRTLDLSSNNIHDPIPYSLPPNLTTLNLANNNLSGNLPYSISTMFALNYMNLGHNSLSQAVGDLFSNLTSLATMDIKYGNVNTSVILNSTNSLLYQNNIQMLKDLSFNNFTGDLPNSFSLLSNLSTCLVQNNQLTGSLNVLAGLPLTDLNVANNHFNGWIPRELLSIPSFTYDGNSFDNGPAPPPPPYSTPPPGRPANNGGHTPPSSRTPGSTHGKPPSNNDGDKKGLGAGPIIGIVFGSAIFVFFAVLALVFCLRKGKQKENAARTFKGRLPIASDKVNSEMQEQRVQPTATLTDVKPVPAENTFGRGKHGSIKRVKSPITATSYTVAALQSATDSFSQENLIGEGSLGRVYRAEFPNGKIMAIKKIDNAALSLQEEDNFVEAVSNMSRLRHPNIVSLAGYCAEHGQRLLVFDYVGNGSLQDLLHYVDDRSKTLTWNARVRVALGTARALEYLHEVCLPSVVHRNFKSANILLDEELNPHLSDCGLATLTPNTERQAPSRQMVGSFGYSAPEFALSGIYTVKSDVYSFGVVMLELLTGRKPLDSSRVRSEQSLVRWATPQLHDIDALARMVDPLLNGMYPAKSLSRFADIIALCVQPEPEFRPPMSEVVQALVRLMQRASMVKRRSNDEPGFIYKTPDHEAYEMSY